MVLIKKLIEVWNGNNLIDKNIIFLKQKTKEVKLPLSHANKKILKDYSNSGDLALTIKLLLDDCITYGTIPFSILARYAFIANSLLRSLVMRMRCPMID